jgi:CheY-like chemotaxis protein
MAQLLVVEDNADILHLIWTQMRARGHQVLGASSGPEALAAVELWGPPQVAVLDVAMPSMDGLELLQQLRTATGMPELPAIFLSARVDRETVEAAHRLGAAYLAKPFMEEILYAAIEAALASGYQGLQAVVEGPQPRAVDASDRWRISAAPGGVRLVRAMPKPPGDAIQPAAGMPTEDGRSG